MVVLRAVFVPRFFGGDRGESRLSRARPLGRCNRPDRTRGRNRSDGRNRCNGDGRSRRSDRCVGRNRSNGRGGDGRDLRFCFGIFYAERAGNGGCAAHI